MAVLFYGRQKEIFMSKEKSGSWFARHKVLTVMLAVIILVVLINALSGDKDNATPVNSSEPTTSNDGAQKKESPAPAKKPDVPAEYRSALDKATIYANTMDMSKKAVYDQLVSSAGEKFSKKAADYAMEHVTADWNANALAKAKTYQETMSMSPSAIRDQLTSSAGEKFTESQAEYAVNHLND